MARLRRFGGLSVDDGRLGQREADLLAAGRRRVGAPVAELAEQGGLRRGIGSCRLRGGRLRGCGWRPPASAGCCASRRHRNAARDQNEGEIVASNSSGLASDARASGASNQSKYSEIMGKIGNVKAVWSQRPVGGWPQTGRPNARQNLDNRAMKAILCTRPGTPDDLDAGRPARPGRRPGRGRGPGRSRGAEFLRHADHRRQVPVQAGLSVLAGRRIRRHRREPRRRRDRACAAATA